MEWNPYEATHGCPSSFVTFGRKHIKCWTCDAAQNWTSKQLSFGKFPMQVRVFWLMTSVCKMLNKNACQQQELCYKVHMDAAIHRNFTSAVQARCHVTPASTMW